MAFYLFILLNAVLFFRPAELVPALEGAPIYESVILMCLAVSVPAIAQKLTIHSLYRQPVIVGVIGLLPAVVLSLLAHGQSEEATQWGFRFFKIVLYFLLLVAVIDTPSRLRKFVGWIGLLIVSMTGLVLLQNEGIINLPALSAIDQAEIDPETGERFTLPRLCGAGIFNDPNDLSVILVVGIILGLYQARAGGIRRVFWLGSVGLLGNALTLTHWRGGFLALTGAALSLIAGRVGFRKAVLIGGPVVLGLAVVMGGRQTSFDLGNSNDTSQHRIRLWRDGLTLLPNSPVFGIGAGRYADECGLVAHNSYVHAYTELGVFGGTLFLGVFLIPLGILYRLGAAGRGSLGPTLQDLRPYVLACGAGTVAGMVSLSRVYTLTPYLILGIATAFLGMSGPAAARWCPRLTPRLIAGVFALSVGSLTGMYVFVRLFAGTG